MAGPYVLLSSPPTSPRGFSYLVSDEQPVLLGENLFPSRVFVAPGPPPPPVVRTPHPAHIHNHDEDVIYHGWLTSSVQVGRSRRRMYYILRASSLTYYTSDGSYGNPLMQWVGWIDTANISHVRRTPTGFTFQASLINLPGEGSVLNRLYSLDADTEDDNFEWFRKLYALADGKRVTSQSAHHHLHHLEVGVTQSMQRIESLEELVNEKNAELQKLNDEIAALGEENRSLRSHLLRMHAMTPIPSLPVITRQVIVTSPRVHDASWL